MGRLIKSWAPIPAKDVEGGAKLGCGFTFISMAALPCGFLLAGTIAVVCDFPQAWRIQATLGLGVVLIGLSYWWIFKSGVQWYEAGRIAIHENGIRYRKSMVLFDEIKSITFGLDATFAERTIPTFEKLQEIRSQHLGYKEQKEALKQNTVGIRTKNGRQTDWKWVLKYFSVEDLRRFVQLVEQQSPGLFEETAAPTSE